MTSRTMAVGLALALSTVPAVGGSTPAPDRIQELLSERGEARTQFGSALSQHRRVLVVGSPRDGAAGRLAGAAHVYRKRGRHWRRSATLRAADAEADDRFGAAVAVQGRWMVVGAPRADGRVGAAYVFEREGGDWTQVARLAPPSPSLGWFGSAVALDRRRIAVGAPRYRAEETGRKAGAVFVFHRRGDVWELEGRLLPQEGDGGLGRSVAVRGGILAVGLADAVDVFERGPGGWSAVQQLRGSRAFLGSSFGGTVVMPPRGVFEAHAREIVVGADREQDTHNRQGAVYVFRREGCCWSETARLLSPQPDHDADFGGSLAAGDDGLVVGETYGLSASGNPGEAWYLARAGAGFAPGRRLISSPLRGLLDIGWAVTVGPAGIAVGEGWGRTVRVVPWQRGAGRRGFRMAQSGSTPSSAAR